jgi:ribosomal protein S18 acetylase RimI-like enzyme
MGDLRIRPYRREDETEVIDLWLECDLVVPHNNPIRDIERKLGVDPEWFVVGVLDGKIVASCMAGYEGHRGWINYLAVSPRYRRKGYAARMMDHVECKLRAAGCPKINLQIRTSNDEVIRFYQAIGYTVDPVVSMGKRLEPDEPYTLRRGDSADIDEA